MRLASSLHELHSQIFLQPQHGLPDVFIWLISEGKRLAFARLPARKIANSVVEDEMGKDSGQVLTLFLRVSTASPCVSSTMPQGWFCRSRNQAAKELARMVGRSKEK